MTTYTMTGPDGKDYSIDGPPGATPQQVAAQMAQQHSATPQVQQQPQGTDVGATALAAGNELNEMSFGVFNRVAPYIGAAASHVTPGPDLTVDQARQKLQQNEDATATAHPYSNVASHVAGIAATVPFGGELIKGAEALPLIGKAAQAVRGMSAVPRLAATAATDSAIGAGTGYVQGGTPGAEAGAVLGPLARPVVAGLGKLAPMFYRVAAGPTKAALSIIASKVGLPGETAAQTYQRVQNAVTEYRGSLGTTPAAAEVAGEPQARELSATIARKPIAAQTAADLQAQAAGLRQSQLSGAVTRGAPPATPLPSGFTPPTTAAQTAVEADAKAGLTKALAPIETRPVTPTAAQSKVLSDNESEIAAKLRGPGFAAARQELSDHIVNGTPLTVRGVETIRGAMGDAAASTDPNANYYRHMRDAIRDIGNNDPDYAKAMAKYGDQRRFASNIPAGAAGTTKPPIDFAAGFDNQPTAVATHGSPFSVQHASELGLADKDSGHFVIMKNGNPAGAIFSHYDPATKTVVVDKIGGTLQPNSIGVAGIRDIAAGIKAHFPQAESISGLRVTGARPNEAQASAKLPTETISSLGRAAQAGQTTGLRTALSQRALQSPNAAAGLAEDLTENSALQQNVHKVFVPTEAARILQAGRIANTSTRGMSAAVPRLSTETAESEANTGLATRAAGVVAHGGSTGIIASVAHHLIHNMNLPSGTALKVAQLAMDPKNTPAVLQYLAKRGTTAAQRHAFMNVVRSGLAAATGNVAGQASGAVDQ